MTAKTINMGKVILKEIRDCVVRRSSSIFFPSIITKLCMKARVRPAVKTQSELIDEINEEILAEPEPTEPVEIPDSAEPIETIPELERETLKLRVTSSSTIPRNFIIGPWTPMSKKEQDDPCKNKNDEAKEGSDSEGSANK
ncbi:hypothetical protein PVK06_035066 [Gossypium arboreum]|uniref:Uncharacterized protein n=1 Tax=Gossypium arboreum TaxID=29729 RepID=A0ABR0NIX4_GOSAR|nr:hypothetical protein PVK06_035066 [Gossypium arboreum]